MPRATGCCAACGAGCRPGLAGSNQFAGSLRLFDELYVGYVFDIAEPYTVVQMTVLTNVSVQTRYTVHAPFTGSTQSVHLHNLSLCEMYSLEPFDPRKVGVNRFSGSLRFGFGSNHSEPGR